jgi:hypothetical protein
MGRSGVGGRFGAGVQEACTYEWIVPKKMDGGKFSVHQNIQLPVVTRDMVHSTLEGNALRGQLSKSSPAARPYDDDPTS